MAIELEKYNGGKGRHTCPSCGRAKQFTRYLDGETREPFADHVGICNRAGKCGYNFTPKMFFAENPNARSNNSQRKSGSPKTTSKLVRRVSVETALDFHTFAHVRASLGKNRDNPFIQYLLNLFPDCEDEILEVSQKYLIGFFNDLTCFWQIDRRGSIRKGKLLRYDARSGKRQTIYRFKQKDDESGEEEEIQINTYWAHRILQKRGEMKQDANLKNCFFGEHLLEAEPARTVCVAEAEKTAVLGALCFPEFVWLATGAQTHLTPERMEVLIGRNVILYPDGDAYALWQEKAVIAQGIGINARVSSFIDRIATEDEKKNGFDLADYIHREQCRIHEFNRYADDYNRKVDSILSSADLQKEFEIICAEREAIMEVPFNSLQPENLREIVETFY